VTVASAIQLAPTDNVATMVSAAENGQEVTINAGSGRMQIVAAEKIPFGFKIAVTDISAGDQVFKYGASIGQATADIAVGTLVHVHNLAGLRAGGDTGRTG
jgi:hypothetical protein